MADETVVVDLKVIDNMEPSIANLKELKKLLKTLPADSEAFGTVNRAIGDMEDSVKSAKGATSDFVDTLASAPGPLGALGKGLNTLKVSTQSFGAALKATGIGLIVSLLGGLVAAFAKTEGSLKKLDPLLIGLEKILGGIVEGFQPLLDIFLDLALKALPYVVSGIKNLYGGLVSFFTLIKEVGVGAAKILKGLFTFDYKLAKEGYEQIKGSWDKTKIAFNEFTDNFEKGYAKQTATQKKNLKEQKEAADKAYDEAVKRADALDKLDEARIDKAKALALAIATTEQEKLDVEVKFAKIKYDVDKQNLEDRLALNKKYGRDTNQVQADLIKLDATYVTTVAANADKLKEIRKKQFEEVLKARSELYDQYYKTFTDEEKVFKQRQIERAASDIDNLYKTQTSVAEFAEFQRKQDEERFALAADNRKKDLADAKAAFDSKLLTELEYKDKVIAINKDYETIQDQLLQNGYDRTAALIQAETDLKRQQVASEKELFDIRKQSYALYADSISSIFSSVAAMYEQDSEAQIALTKISILVRGAAAIADTILSAKAQLAQYSLAGATAKATIIQGVALSSNPLTLPIGIAMTAAGSAAQAAATAGKVATLIGSGLQVAAIGVSTAAQIAAVDAASKSKGGSSGASGGSVGSGEASSGGGTPAFSTPQIGAPQIGATGSQSGTIAGIVAGTLVANQSQGQPLRAYVVGNDITTEQQLQRRLRTMARLGG